MMVEGQRLHFRGRLARLFGERQHSPGTYLCLLSAYYPV